MFINDLQSVENPRNKNKVNFYSNEYNFYAKNSIKNRHEHLKNYSHSINRRKEEMEKYPLPKMLYSISNFDFYRDNKNILRNVKEQFTKHKIHEAVDGLVKFVDNFDFWTIDDEEDKNIESKRQNNAKNDEDTLDAMKNRSRESDIFLTRQDNDLEFKKNIHKNKAKEYLEDINKIKPIQSVNVISDSAFNEIKSNQKMSKESIVFSDYGKYKFSRTGLLYPRKLNKYQLPEYSGNNQKEKTYYDYKKKVRNPNLVYSKLATFDETFNKNLGKINTTYGGTFTRTRFVENPILKEYADSIPLYEIYKDLKQIENRYAGSKFKFKLLPLYNKKITNLDKLADKFYKKQKMHAGLSSLLQINQKKGTQNNNNRFMKSLTPNTTNFKTKSKFME